MSVYFDWVWSATSVSVWQHVQLSEQMRPWDTLACCWYVKQPTNKIRDSTFPWRATLWLVLRHPSKSIVFKLQFCFSILNNYKNKNNINSDNEDGSYDINNNRNVIIITTSITTISTNNNINNSSRNNSSTTAKPITAVSLKYVGGIHLTGRW